LVGTKVLDARAAVDRGRLSHFIDDALGIAYPFNRGDHTRSATSRRISALYGQLYQLEQLNQRTLDAMPEMFGAANLAGFQQLAHIARKRRVVRADGTDDYVTDANFRHFAIPTLFVHGAENRAFEPSGTRKTKAELSRVNGARLYERIEIAETGHIDCIFGKNAVDTVYPAILAHLDRVPK
jgi:cholesterol oxidase